MDDVFLSWYRHLRQAVCDEELTQHLNMWLLTVSILLWKQPQKLMHSICGYLRVLLSSPRLLLSSHLNVTIQTRHTS